MKLTVQNWQEKQLIRQLNLHKKQRQAYAVHVITPGETKVTQYNSRDAETGEHAKEHLKAQGREPTHYVETAGKMLTSHSRRYF